MKILCLMLVLAALPIASATAEISGVVVVRHAEKADDGTADPELTVEGHARARALASALAPAQVGGLIASHYRRTRQTLEPLADERGLDVMVVTAHSGAIGAHIESIVEKVHESDAEGLLVIAGHSNTVPLIVEALSGRVVAPIAESEYDRLFVLLPGEPGMDVVATRYGAESGARAD